METPKYYTPDIEELHVGFEIEFKNTMQKNEWEKNICDSDMLNIAFSIKEEGGINEFANCIRVKYLDKEDIEDLGWEKESVINIWAEEDGIFIDGFTLRTDDTHTYVLLIDEETNAVGIYLQLIYNEVTGNWTQHIMFSGIIMNKSELKKLMNQLDIR